MLNTVSVIHDSFRDSTFLIQLAMYRIVIFNNVVANLPGVIKTLF